MIEYVGFVFFCRWFLGIYLHIWLIVICTKMLCMYAGMLRKKYQIINIWLNGVRSYVQRFISEVDVYLLFDKYKKFSIKSDTRAERLGRLRRAFTLSTGSPLPSKDVTMKTTATKVQLIQLIANDLLSFFLDSKRKIVVTIVVTLWRFSWGKSSWCT